MIQPFNPQIDQQIASLNQNRGRGGSPAVDPRVLRQSEEARDQDFMLQAAGMRAGIGNAQLQSRTALEAARMGSDANLKAAQIGADSSMKTAQLQSETWKSQHAADRAEADQRHEAVMAGQAEMKRQYDEGVARAERELEQNRKAVDQVAKGVGSIGQERSRIRIDLANGVAGARAEQTARLEELGKEQIALQAAYGRALLTQGANIHSVRRAMESWKSNSSSSSQAFRASLEASSAVWAEVVGDVNNPTWDGRDSQSGFWGGTARFFGADNRKEAPDGREYWQLGVGTDEDSVFWKSRGYHKSQHETTRSSVQARLIRMLANGTKSRDPEQVAPVVDEILSLVDGTMNGVSFNADEITRRVGELQKRALAVGINPQTLRAAMASGRATLEKAALATFDQLREVVPDTVAFLGPVGILDSEGGGLRAITPEELHRHQSLGDALVGEDFFEQSPTLERMNAMVHWSNGFDKVDSLLAAGGIEDQADFDRQVFIIDQLIGGIEDAPLFTELSGDSLEGLYSRYGEPSDPGGLSRTTLADAILRSSGEGPFVPLAANEAEALALIESNPTFRALAEWIDKYGDSRAAIRHATTELKTGKSDTYDFGDEFGGMQGLDETRKQYLRDHLDTTRGLIARAQQEGDTFMEALLANEELTPEAKAQLASMGLQMLSFDDMAQME